jgi:hypothetical protein
MNAGVEIILERIKTHPEEFANKGGGKLANGKWSRVLENYAGHLEQEDIDAINNAIDKVNQDYFTEEVMTILADGRDIVSDEDGVSLNSMAHSITTTQKRPRMISSATLNTGAISGTWATPTITIPPTNK